MSGPASQQQWYLARDGKQHGPISEPELVQFLEQGHLLPTDLLWREGFADWRPAMTVFAPRGPAASRPPPRRPAADGAPAARQRDAFAAEARSYGDGFDDTEGRRGSRLGRIAAVVVVAAALAGAGALAFFNRARLAEFATALTASSGGAMTVADRKSLEVPPLAGFRGGTPASIDAALQATALWSVIKREFPEWYEERVKEAAALARENKDDVAIGQHMAAKLREFRRQQVSNALSATQPRLKTVATAFLDNLSKLREHSPQACHGFINGGEANPAIVALLQGSEFTPGLQAQLTVMFEAIAEGRKQPRVYPRPNQQEFEQLAKDLFKMGWTQEDLVLFINARELAKAPPETQCRLVHDFFKAQLAFSDPDVRMKLIISSLGPVFGG
jgi:hypothetical protein